MKTKLNINDLILSTNQCRSDVSSAIIDLALSAKKQFISGRDFVQKIYLGRQEELHGWETSREVVLS